MIRLIDLLREDITAVDVNRILKRTGDEQDLYEPDWEEFTPELCNTGFCDIFAEKFREEYPGAELWGTNWGTEESPFGHIWIKYKNLYYDAETPDGVKDWKNIPFIQRVFKTWNKYPDDVIQLGISNN